MLDYGTLPPEINSGRMYSGPGSGPMVAAAAAWDVLANGLESASRGYTSVISQLQGESWSGGASTAMTGAVTPYVAWLTIVGTQAEQAASQARAAAAAYEVAFAATVPRTGCRQSHAVGAIGRDERLRPEHGGDRRDRDPIPRDVGPGRRGDVQLRRILIGRDNTSLVRSAAANHRRRRAICSGRGGRSSHWHLSGREHAERLVETDNRCPATVASPRLGRNIVVLRSESSATSSALSAFSNFDAVTGPVSLGGGISRTITSGGSFGTGLFRSNIQSAADAAKAAAGAGTTTTAPVRVSGPVLASAGNAGTVGKLSVPQSWATTNPAVTSVTEPHWLSDTELDGPSWHEGAPTNMFNGVPAATAGRPRVTKAFDHQRDSQVAGFPPRDGGTVETFAYAG